MLDRTVDVFISPEAHKLCSIRVTLGLQRYPSDDLIFQQWLYICPTPSRRHASVRLDW